MESVKSSDVLDPTHEAKHSFRATVIGYFRRKGPNAWDDYEFTRLNAGDASSGNERPDQSSIVEVLPQVPLQLEAHGPMVRLRSEGRVIRVRWLPESDDLELLGADPEPREIRRYFVEHCLVALAEAADLGAGAVMAKKLVL